MVSNFFMIHTTSNLFCVDLFISTLKKISTRVCHFKLVLLGVTSVGNSCLVVRFVRDEFFEFQEPTIRAVFLIQTVALDDAAIKFEI